MKIFFLIILASVGLFVFVPDVFADDSFFGTSSFENVPSEISRHYSSTFDIKLQYTLGPWGLDDLSPVIEISPEQAASSVNLDFDPVSVYKGSVARIPVTITLNPAIDYEKIFLSVSFEGINSNMNKFKSGWTDSLILSISPRDVISHQVDYEKISWTQFPQNDRAVIYKKNSMNPLSILEKGQQYSIIQKVDFSDDNFAENSTFNAVVGYAYQKGDKMIHPPRGENTSDAEHQEFAENNRKLNNNFYQNSEIAKSFEFMITVDGLMPQVAMLLPGVVVVLPSIFHVAFCICTPRVLIKLSPY